MIFFRNIQPAWALRIGLGLMYVYSGTSLIRQPFDWQGFLPMWFADAVSRLMPLASYLRLQGVGELFLAAVMLAWVAPRRLLMLASGVAALELSGILALSGVDLITFRDIGLLGAALGLFLLVVQSADTRQS